MIELYKDTCTRLQRGTLCIDEEPTVDAVPVIRCKDCKWYEFDRKMHCGLPHGVRSKDDYCSDAERREE